MKTHVQGPLRWRRLVAGVFGGLFALTVLLPSGAAASPTDRVSSRTDDVLRSLSVNAKHDPVAAEGLELYAALSDKERAALEAYARSDRFVADVTTAMSRVDSQSLSVGERQTMKVGQLRVETVAEFSEQSATLHRLAGGEASDRMMQTAAKTWYVSVQYSQRMSFLGVPLIWYYHRLHYNHNGNSVTGTRGCEAWNSGFTGGWTLTPYPSHYRSGGVGFCKTRWHWKAPWVSLNFTFRMGVDANARIVLREWT